MRGVKILGLESRNGRVYLPEALKRAARLYEGAKVNVNHPKGDPRGPRDYQDRIGVIREVTVRDGEGLFGDFHFNPRHALAEQLVWDAVHAPENVGFSHNVQAKTSRRGERVVVEAITKVESVDLVADPATTRGLFESDGSRAGLPADATEGDSKESWARLLEAERAKRCALEEELMRLREDEAKRARRSEVVRLLREFELPEPGDRGGEASVLVSEVFLQTVLEAGEAERRALVEDRARLVRHLEEKRALSVGTGGARGPVSRDQGLVERYAVGERDVAAFARSIR